MNKQNRKDVYALYSMCRHADDIVDLDAVNDKKQAKEQLNQFKEDVVDAITNKFGNTDLLNAISETWNRLQVDMEYIDRFFTSMEMDITVSRYETFEDLMLYMDGSAAVIGEMILPILVQDKHEHENLRESARSLGIGFQLTNFIRDISEDLERGRIYIPMEDFKKYEVNPDNIIYNDNFINMLKFNVERTKGFYFDAYPGVQKLSGRRAACVRTAYRLYGGILSKVIDKNYNVLAGRAVVKTPVKAGVAVKELLRPNKNTFAINNFI